MFTCQLCQLILSTLGNKAELVPCSYSPKWTYWFRSWHQGIDSVSGLIIYRVKLSVQINLPYHYFPSHKSLTIWAFMVRSQEQPPEVWHCLTVLVYAPLLLQHKIKHSQLHYYRINTATAFHTALICLSVCMTVGIYCVFWTPTLCCHRRDQDAFQAIPLEALKRHPLDRCAHSVVKFSLHVFKGICSYEWSQLHITGHSNDWWYFSKEYLLKTNVITSKWLNFWTRWKQNCVQVPWKCTVWIFYPNPWPSGHLKERMSVPTVWIKLATSNQSLRKHVIQEVQKKEKPKSWMLKCSSFDTNQPWLCHILFL
jgi:hypothetical protein